MKKHLLSIASTMTIAALAPHAHAWESECRPEADAAARYGGHAGSSDDSICADVAPFCEFGLEWTRGALLGEHHWITRRAMLAAGLSDWADRPLPEYWVDGSTVANPDGMPVKSLIPARLGGGNELVTRKTTIAEVAQAADGSHTLADFLLGNETCTVENMPYGTPQDMKACHSFNPHMGAVNSTHFLPQAKNVYERYHDLALETAARCKELGDAGAASPDFFATDYIGPAVEQCVHEALLLESMASHFLADAWATGHMWERWGVPHAAPLPYQRLAQSIVATTSGMIHGWRSVVRAEAGLIEALGIQLQHDQMCMAGPFDPDGDEFDKNIIKFVMPETGEVVAGGGDLYLLPCLAYNEDREWSVSSGNGLATQRKRMMSCIALGFQEVYNATKDPAEALPPPVGEWDSALDGARSTSDLCWGGRVTNSSFKQGLALSDKATLANPGTMANLVLGTVMDNQAEGLARVGVTEQEVERVSRHMRSDLVGLAALAKFWAEAEPDGTQLASLEQKQQFLGNGRNRAFVSGNSTGYVRYLERQRAAWDHAVSNKECTTDTDCWAPFGEYCDHTVSSEPRCTSTGAPYLRMFGEGELLYYCQEVPYWELDRAREHCRTIGTTGACEQCADFVLPHIRNGCDDASFNTDPPGGLDPRSMCDVYAGEENAPIYRRHDATSAAELRAVALEICREEPPATPPQVGFWQPKAQPVDASLDATTPSVDVLVESWAPGSLLDWNVTNIEPSLSITPATWSVDGGVPQTVSIQATDTTASFITDVEFANQCNPELRAAVTVRVGNDFTHLDFDAVPDGPIDGTQWQADGVVFSAMDLYGGQGDDAIGSGFLCASTGRGCNSAVTMDFLQPVTTVSFYVGDLERDFEGTFSIVVMDGSGAVVDSVTTNYDRRFYSFTGTDIRQIVFTPSNEWELVDELYFIKAP